MESRSKMRIVGLVSAPVLLVGGITVGVAAPAMAHTGNLPVGVVCNTTTGQYDFTAKLALSNTSGKTGTTMWRIGTSNFDGTPTSNTGMDRGPITTVGDKTVTLVGTEQGDVKYSLPGTTTGLGPWFYAFSKWSGATAGSDGQNKVKLNGDCKPADKYDASASVSVTPRTCYEPEKLVLGQAVNAGWGTPTRTTGPGNYSVVATGNVGPPQHLFPSGTGVSTDGKTKTFTGTLKDKDTSKDCWVKDAEASVTPTPGTCYAPGSAAVTGLKNATLVGTLDQSVGTHTATFKSNEGHLFPNGSETKQVPYTVTGKDKSLCDVVTPVNPTVGQSVCVNGSPSAPTLMLATTKGGAYTVSAQAPYSAGQTVVVTFTTDDFSNLSANLPTGWVKTSATTATFTVMFTKPDCTVIVQPPTVPVLDECGPGNAVFGTVPAGPWTWVINPDGSLTITANTGNAFPNGSSVTTPAPVDSNVACPTPPVPPTPPTYECPKGTTWVDDNGDNVVQPGECKKPGKASVKVTTSCTGQVGLSMRNKTFGSVSYIMTVRADGAVSAERFTLKAGKSRYVVRSAPNGARVSVKFAGHQPIVKKVPGKCYTPPTGERVVAGNARSTHNLSTRQTVKRDFSASRPSVFTLR